MADLIDAEDAQRYRAIRAALLSGGPEWSKLVAMLNVAPDTATGVDDAVDATFGEMAMVGLRDAFEAWARGPAGYVDDQLAKYADGTYQDSTTRLHWSTWQAAWRAAHGDDHGR